MAQQITSRSIIELLLRQHVDDNLLDRLLSVLPLNDDDPNLKKALLLRRIQTEVTNATVSEKLLELLELVGELDFRHGKVPLEAMKSAYCAVAVDCTVRFLGLDNENVKYFETLKSLWDVRVGKIEKSENPGLISERLRGWKDDLEAATSDSELCEKIVSRNTRNEALKAVEGYLAQAWNEIHEPLEEQCFQGSENVIIIPSDSPCDERGPSVRLKSVGNVMKMRKTGHEIHEHEEEQGSENVTMAHDETIPRDRPSVVADKLIADLKSCFANLRAIVTDPLPEALRIAERVVSEMDREAGLGGNNVGEMRQVPASMESLGANRVRIAERVVSEMDREAGLGGNNVGEMHQVPASMESLGANSVESVGCSDPPEQKECKSGRDLKKLSKGPRRKWSVLEEDTLREGVEKYGRGRWKLILEQYSDIFEGRTNMNLKDKWRNMTST